MNSTTAIYSKLDGFMLKKENPTPVCLYEPFQCIILSFSMSIWSQNNHLYFFMENKIKIHDRNKQKRKQVSIYNQCASTKYDQ